MGVSKVSAAEECRARKPLMRRRSSTRLARGIAMSVSMESMPKASETSSTWSPMATPRVGFASSVGRYLANGKF